MHAWIYIKEFLFTFVQSKQLEQQQQQQQRRQPATVQPHTVIVCAVYLLLRYSHTAIDTRCSPIERKRVEMNLTRERILCRFVSCVKPARKPIHRLHVLQWKCAADCCMLLFFIGFYAFCFKRSSELWLRLATPRLWHCPCTYWGA